jgi:hypothetical protein
MKRRTTLGLMAAMAMLATTAQEGNAMHRESDQLGDAKRPDNRGRRAEKNAATLAKAEEKRKRRAAKRAALVPHNGTELTGTAKVGHNK